MSGAPSAMRCAARLRRRLRMYAASPRPVEATKARERWKRETPAALAISSRDKSAPRCPSTYQRALLVTLTHAQNSEAGANALDSFCAALQRPARHHIRVEQGQQPDYNGEEDAVL